MVESLHEVLLEPCCELVLQDRFLLLADFSYVTPPSPSPYAVAKYCLGATLSNKLPTAKKGLLRAV